MSEFKTHFLGGLVAGVATTSYYYVFQQGSLNSTQLTAVFLCGVIGGLLPDLDSDTGKPLEMLFGLISVIIPVTCLKYVSGYFVVTPEFLVSYFVLAYLLINYVILEGVKRVTRHRGIMHSIPFAVLCGEAGALLFLASGKNIAMAAGIAVFVGALIHLILDELHSIRWKWGFFPVANNSSGSALTLKSNSIAVTITVYLLVTITGLPILRALGYDFFDKALAAII
jgi:membrane-bound metal-dependent hydrolase YbcI (DUF457 family)